VQRIQEQIKYEVCKLSRAATSTKQEDVYKPSSERMDLGAAGKSIKLLIRHIDAYENRQLNIENMLDAAGNKQGSKITISTPQWKIYLRDTLLRRMTRLYWTFPAKDTSVFMMR